MARPKKTTLPQEKETNDKDVIKTVKKKEKEKKRKIASFSENLTVQKPSTKTHKLKFKDMHIKDTYWIENDLYQTIIDMTNGSKEAKAFIMNQALKDYFRKNKIEIKPLRGKKHLQ